MLNDIIVPYYVDKRLAGLMTAVAKHLSGQSVVVELRTPSSTDTRGCFTRTEDTGHIQIEPKLTHSDTLYVFCHETAHALLHWQSIRPTKRHLAGPAAFPNSSGQYPNYQEDEDAADALAELWLTYATRWHAIDEEPDDYLQLGLERLLTYENV